MSDNQIPGMSADDSTIAQQPSELESKSKGKAVDTEAGDMSMDDDEEDDEEDSGPEEVSSSYTEGQLQANNRLDPRRYC